MSFPFLNMSQVKGPLSRKIKRIQVNHSQGLMDGEWGHGMCVQKGTCHLSWQLDIFLYSKLYFASCAHLNKGLRDWEKNGSERHPQNRLPYPHWQDKYIWVSCGPSIGYCNSGRWVWSLGWRSLITDNVQSQRIVRLGVPCGAPVTVICTAQ